MERIVNVIKKLLNKEYINLSDSFFENGGTSIKALILTSEIGKLYNISISIAEIYEYKTIGGIISLIENRKNSVINKNDNSYFYFQKFDKDKDNLFLIPPVVGTSIIYGQIAALIGDSYNPIGLEYPGFYSDSEIVDTFQMMVSIMFEKMKQMQCNREFNILGYSMGGLIGFEIAKKIEKELDGKVRLILIDSASEEMLYDVNKENNPDDVLRQIMMVYKEHLSIHQIEHYRRFLKNNISIITDYVATGTIKGNLTVFEAKNGNYNMSKWSQHTSGCFERKIVDGDHFTVIKEISLHSKLI